MFPKDYITVLPEPLVENLDESGQALLDLAQDFTETIVKDILDIWYFKFPEQTRVVTLDYWNQYLEADFVESDGERAKRQKIYSAVQRHKLRGTFEDDIKLTIDAITGKDSNIVKATYIFEDDDSVIVGGTMYEDTLYSTIGTNGVDEFGTYIPEIITSTSSDPGNVAIDLGLTEEEIFVFQNDDSIIVSDNTGTDYYSSIGADSDDELGTFIPSGQPSSDIEELLDEIELALQDSLPAYLNVILGYIDDDGNFVELRELQEL